MTYDIWIKWGFEWKLVQSNAGKVWWQQNNNKNYTCTLLFPAWPCAIQKNNRIWIKEFDKIEIHESHRIIRRNSSKLRTPSPFWSNPRIITLHASTVHDSPSRLSVLRKLAAVINSSPSVTYIRKASLSSFLLSSSLPSSPSISFKNSSKSISPSPSTSEIFTTSSASREDNAPPKRLTQFCSSVPEIFPSEFASM